MIGPPRISAKLVKIVFATHDEDLTARCDKRRKKVNLTRFFTSCIVVMEHGALPDREFDRFILRKWLGINYTLLIPPNAFTFSSYVVSIPFNFLFKKLQYFANKQ